MMNRSEFMFRLAQLLADLPIEERADALKFYNTYFDDAGPEDEARIIEELGSPEAVARSIKVGVMDGDGEYSEQGFRENYKNTEANMPQPGARAEKTDRQADSHTSYSHTADGNTSYGNSYGNTAYSHAGHGGSQPGGEGRSNFDNAWNSYSYAGAQPKAPKRRMSGGAVVLIIILCVLASPAILGIGGGLLGLALGLAGGLFGIIAAVGGTAIGCIFGGLAELVMGIIRIFSEPAKGMMSCGAALISIAAGLLLCILMLWLCTTVVPFLYRKVRALCLKIFKRRKRA